MLFIKSVGYQNYYDCLNWQLFCPATRQTIKENDQILLNHTLTYISIYENHPVSYLMKDEMSNRAQKRSPVMNKRLKIVKIFDLHIFSCRR